MAAEMLRVTRPGGIDLLSATPCGSDRGAVTRPHRGTTSAVRRARPLRRRLGHEPKNRYGESLFRLTVRDGLAWANAQTARRGGRHRPPLLPAVDTLAAQGPAGPRGGDVEPRPGSAQSLARSASARPRTRSRDSARCSPAQSLLATRDPVQSPGRAASPDTKFDLASLPPGSSPARSTSGIRSAPSASCRTRRTATSGRWARSSCSDLSLTSPGGSIQRSWMALVIVRGAYGRGAGGASPRGALGPCLPGWRPCLRAVTAMLTDARPDLDRGLAESHWRPGSCFRSWRARHAARRGEPRRRRPWPWRWCGGVNAVAAFAVLPLGVLWLLTGDARPTAPDDDAVVAGVHRGSRRCGGWSRSSSGRVQPAVPRLHRIGFELPPSRRPCSTHCVAPLTGCRTSTRTRGPGTISSASSSCHSTAGSSCSSASSGCSSATTPIDSSCPWGSWSDCAW